MTNQRANGALSISVSLRLPVLAIVVAGLTGWLTLAGLTSPFPSTSVSGAKATFSAEADQSSRPDASTLTTPDRGSYAHVSDAYGKLPLQFEANAGQTDASVKFLSRGSGYSLFLTSTEAVLVLRQTTSHDDGIPGSAADRHLEDENGIDLRGQATEDRRESRSPQAVGVTAQDAVLRMKFEGANLLPRVEGAEQLTGYVNYFIGNDPAKWRTGISTYARVRYEGVYPGVDVAYYGNQRQLEYDLMVAPGANPDVIKLRYDGVKGIRVDHDGNLMLRTEAGEIRQDKPEVYQCIEGVRKNVESGYVRRGKNEVGFKVSRYDRRQPLVIDPILTYSTYLGGNGSDQGLGIAVDSAGNAYVTGSVGSSNFPTLNPIQTAQTGGDAFVAKLNAAGTALVYSTYLGGATFDQANGIAVDASGNAYVTGRTDSFNFPMAAAIQSTKSGSPFFKSINGGTNWSSSATGLAGANVRDVAINPASPATIYSATEIGVFKSTNGGGNWSATGLFNVFIEAIAIDPVTTTTLYAGGTGGVNKTTNAGTTWTAINNGLLVSNSFVPAVNAIVVDPTNSATLYAGTASGGGVFKSTNGGANWTAVNNGLTFISGSSTFIPTVNGLNFDPGNPATLYASTSSGGVYKSSNGGGTWSAINNGLGTFPTVNALVIDGTNPATLYAGTFSGVFKSTDGGSNWSAVNNGLTNFTINALAIDPTSPLAIYAGTSTGIFKSSNGGGIWNLINNGLTTVNINALAIDKTTPANVYAGTNSSSDTFVTKLNATGSALVYSTYLGGFDFDQGNGIAVDTSNNAYVTGETSSSNFPTANPRQPANGGFTDAFVTKLNSAGSALLYSTYLGGNSTDQGRGIAVDGSGNAYITGNTFSTNFPTASAIQAATGGSNDAFVTKLNSIGSALIYSTYLGGSSSDIGRGIAVDGVGQTYVTGETSSTNFPTASPLQSANGGGTDAFVTKLNSVGTGFVYSTYLGGNSTDQAFGIAADAAGNAYVTGQTFSTNFPVRSTLQPSKSAGFDVFVTKFNSPGSAFIYSTFLGGNSTDQGRGIVVDSLGNAYVTGLTFSTNFPTAGPLQSTNHGSSNAFVAKLGAAADLSVTIGTSPSIPTDGNNLTYTISVLNNGELNATGVILSDTLPQNATFVSVSTTQGSCTRSGGTVTCSLGSLNNGSAVTVTIVVTPTTGTIITNTASVIGNEPDGNTSNNSRTVNTAINPADLSVALFDSPNPVVVGNDLTYTAIVTNNGPLAATGVNTLTDTLPTSVTLVSTSAGCGISGNTVTCNIGNLVNGATATVKIIVRPTTAGAITNTVSVAESGNQADPNTANNTATKTNTVNATAQPGLVTKDLSTQNPGDLASAILGSGVSISNVSYKGVISSAGTFTGGTGIIGFENGIVLSSGVIQNVIGPNQSDGISRSNGSPGDSDLSALIGGTLTNDATVLEFDFVPNNNVISFQYVFASDEYNEFVYSFNDVFGLFVNGTNVALVPGTTTPVSIDNVNGGNPFGTNARNSQYYRNNDLSDGGGSINTEMDGLTVVLLAQASVNPGQVNHIKLAIADARDTVLDSNVFIKASSLTGQPPADLSITMTDLPHPVPTSSNLTYTMTVTNNGPNPATGVTITDTLPSSGITFVSATTGCSLSGNTVTCNLGNLANGATTSKNIVVGVNAASGLLTNIATVAGNEPDPNTGNNTATVNTSVFTPASISGRVTDGNNNGIGGVQVTLSGTLTRVVPTDANGNYSFNDLVGGGNYSVVASSPLFIFNPPRFDFTNLTASQTANFVQVPNAVPSPTPPPSDNFNGAQRDPQKWNLGTATQPAGAFDPQVTVAQTSGQLVITPLANVGGPHYNGYVSVNSFDMRNGSVSVELVKAATGGADTIFAVGTDAENFFRFLVHTPGAPTSLAPMTRGKDGIARPLDTTTAQLIFQVKIGGQLQPDPPTSIPYDPVQHRFMRFRHEPPTNSIVFETSPNVDFNPISFQNSVVLQKSVSALTAELSAGTSSPTNPGQATFDNFNLVTSTFQFSAGSYTVGEGDGSVPITVTRAGSTGTAATVDYTTADGTASQRNKYIPAIGTLRFAAGETIKSFSVLIEDNFLVEGNETVNLLLGNPVGSGLNSPGRAVLTIVDNDTVPATSNPLDDATFFAHQHYFDFLNRQPDASGLNFWRNEITSCGADLQCIEVKRINVSGAFFVSIEFQQTGYLVERIYKASYGDAIGTSTLNGAHQLPVPIIRLNEFLPDTQEIGQGVVVNQGDWRQQLENNKQAFTAEFVQRARFTTAFPTTLTPAQFVDKLNQNAGNPLSQSERDQLVSDLTSGAKTRAQVLRAVAEDSDLNNSEFNRAFVLMQYLGYLRRNPNDPQDSDYTGYDFWLTKLNQFNGNFQNAEMVKAFISAIEYRQRFGP